MSMYGAIFGRNPASGALLAMIGLDERMVGRFRDAYVTEHNGTPAIAVYTRNGGGNRECWCEMSGAKYGTERCKHHDIVEEVDERVELPWDSENPVLPEGHRWANVFIGSKRQAFTGRKVSQTYHVCEEPNSAACHCVGCFMEYHVVDLPGYICDTDDDFDCTYATILFQPPEEWRDLIAGLVREGSPDTDWQDFLTALQDPPEEPASRPQQLAVRLIEQTKAPSHAKD